MKHGHISLSASTTARGRMTAKALLTKDGKSRGLYMRTSSSATSRSAMRQPVELVVEKQNLAPGSALRHSRISCPATCTSPTETACTHTNGFPGEESFAITSGGYSPKRSHIRAA